jgi:acetyl-CoA carboxylase carboxyltransferase component
MFVQQQQQHERQFPSMLMAAGAYQPEEGYAIMDLGFPKYNVDDGPAYKGPQGEPGGILSNSAEKEEDLSNMDPKQAAKLQAKRLEAAKRAQVEQEKQMAKLKALAAKQQAQEAAQQVKLEACESGTFDDLDLSPNEKSKLIKKCNAAAVRKQKEQVAQN